ncbi:putative thermostable alkaline protease [Paramyrothecium foliicola]|nr:putative thermostable alkaline protease [Paramyrothecium foliicola]
MGGREVGLEKEKPPPRARLRSFLGFRRAKEPYMRLGWGHWQATVEDPPCQSPDGTIKEHYTALESWWELCWAVYAIQAAASSSVEHDDLAQPVDSANILSNVYIAELQDDQDDEEFLNALRNEPDVNTVTRRLTFRPSLFHGVSFAVNGSLDTATATLQRRIEAFPHVKQLWPVERVTIPKPDGKVLNQESGARNKRRQSNLAKTPNIMTQVDKLHAEGVTGKGFRIGIIDTGIDWRHPALGGCYGPGCLIEYGYDFYEDDEDPLDTCHGHGTVVAGMIGALENPYGFVGSAPGAKLGMYRLSGCDGSFTTDTQIAAILKAYEDGSDIITTSAGYENGWAEHPIAVVMARVAKAGVACLAANGNAGGGNYGLFSAVSPAAGDGVMAIASFQNAQVPSINGETGDVTFRQSSSPGWVDNYSGWGPTFRGEMKPQFGGVGGDVLTTAIGGYTVVSGTSLSTPLVAGIVALIFEVRGKMSAVEIKNLLSSTANPAFAEVEGNHDSIGSAAQQGGGLVQAWDAAYETTLVDVSSFSFNDTEFQILEKEFTLTNTGNTTAVYNFSHVSAPTFQTLWDNGYRRSTPVIMTTANELADLHFEPSSLTLPPGSRGSVLVKLTPPSTEYPATLPVYSGYVSINGTSDREISLSIPYVGISSAMRNTSSVGVANQYAIFDSNNPRMASVASGTVFQVPVPEEHPEWARSVNSSAPYIPVGSEVGISAWLRFGASEVHVELLPVAPSCRVSTPVADENLWGDKSLGAMRPFPVRHIAPIGFWTTWDFRLQDGSWAPPGRYAARMYTLKHYGDRTNVDDWDVVDFQGADFGITYVQV